MAGRSAAAARHRPLHGVCRAHARSEDRRSGAARMRLRATVSTSARSARKKTHARRVERLKAAGLQRRRHRAHPCADRARHRRGVAAPRSRSRSWARSPRGCGSRGAGGMKFRSGSARRGARRHRRAYHPPGRAGAQEGHADRRRRSRGAEGGRRIAQIMVARTRAGRRVRGSRPRPRSRKRSPGEGVRVDRAFHRTRQSVSPRARACWWSTRTRSTGSTAIDEAITFATLPAFKPVVAGEMIATVKIIPFAVGECRARRRRCAVHRRRWCALRPIARSESRRGLARCCRGLPARSSKRRSRSPRERLAPAGAAIIAERRVPHDQVALAQAHRRGAQGRRRAGHRVRRVRDCRPARRDPGRARGDRRAHGAFRHAGRSRQSAC